MLLNSLFLGDYDTFLLHLSILSDDDDDDYYYYYYFGYKI